MYTCRIIELSERSSDDLNATSKEANWPNLDPIDADVAGSSPHGTVTACSRMSPPSVLQQHSNRFADTL